MRSRELRRLFDEAVKLPDRAAQRRFLRARASDPGLEHEVLELLDADAEGDEVFDSTWSDPRRRADSRTVGRPGLVLDEIVLEEELGAGGMGVVWSGVDRSTGRRVGVKLLRGQRGEDAALPAEVEALVALDSHPSIATVYRAGVFQAEGGRFPWFAMELVQGNRGGAPCGLVAYADSQGLDQKSRLQLFLEVCDAVEYVHAHGIVHRDLKPDNVLVGVDGRPRIVDFGIAATVDAEGSESMGGTGTPAYVAPERFAGTGLPSTSWDIYSLGVILWELVAGRRPYDVPTDLFSAAAWWKTERSEGLELPRIHLPRDLEAVLCKAVAPDARHRYATTSGLASDVRAFLEGRVVAARPVGIVHTVYRACRRHPLRSIAALVLVGVTAYGTRADRRADSLARDAGIHSRVTELVLSEANLHPSRIPNLFRHLQGLSDTGGAAPVFERLSLQQIGAGDFEGAVVASRQVIDMIRDEHGDDDPLLVDAYLWHARNLLAAADYLSSVEFADRAVQHAVASYGPADPEVESARSERLRIVRILGLKEEVLEAALAARGAPRQSMSAKLLIGIARSFLRCGRPDLALAPASEAVEFLESLPERSWNRWAEARRVFASLLWEMGRGRRAVEVLRTAVEPLEATGEHGLALARLRDALASKLMLVGDYPQALDVIDSALEGAGRDPACDSRLLAGLLGTRARVLACLGRHRHALADLDTVLHDLGLPAGDRWIAYTLEAKHGILSDLGDYGEAERCLVQAQDVASASELGQDMWCVSLLNRLGTLRRMTGEPRKALELYERALASYEAGGEAYRAETAWTYNCLAAAALDEGDASRAVHWNLRALGLQKGLSARAESLCNLGEAYLELSEWPRAVRSLERSLHARRRQHVSDHWLIARTENLLGAALHGSGDVLRGLQLLEQSLERLEEGKGSDYRETRAARARWEAAR